MVKPVPSDIPIPTVHYRAFGMSQWSDEPGESSSRSIDLHSGPRFREARGWLQPSGQPAVLQATDYSSALKEVFDKVDRSRQTQAVDPAYHVSIQRIDDYSEKFAESDNQSLSEVGIKAIKSIPAHTRDTYTGIITRTDRGGDGSTCEIVFYIYPCTRKTLDQVEDDAHTLSGVSGEAWIRGGEEGKWDLFPPFLKLKRALRAESTQSTHAFEQIVQPGHRDEDLSSGTTGSTGKEGPREL